jgi:hemin uptake protein HemP
MKPETPQVVNQKEPVNTETPTIDAKTLFGERSEIVILLDGTRYRLRITRKNRLILQK